MKKYAVITLLNENERNGHYVSETEDVIKITFLKKLDTGLISDCLWTPRNLYMSVKNDKYLTTGKKSIKYGVIRSSANLGSFSECFYLSKKDIIIELLKKHNYIIIEK